MVVPALVLLTILFSAAAQDPPAIGRSELEGAQIYAARFVPGGTSDENRNLADRAIHSFQNVLKREPNNRSALSGLASIYRKLEEFDKAREYCLRRVELNPLDAESFIEVGAMDWVIVSEKKSTEAVEQLEFLIAEGLRHLDIALAINPEFVDAMTYRSLLLREKARLAADIEERARLLAEADMWFNKALDTRKRIAANRIRQQSTIPPPPPPPPVPPADVRVRVMESVMQRQLIFRPEIVFPTPALEAGVQGVVVVEAFISDIGFVEQVRTISGHQLLVAAALDVVKNSRYEPIRLNGLPAKAVTTVTVTFKLQ